MAPWNKNSSTTVSAYPVQPGNELQQNESVVQSQVNTSELEKADLAFKKRIRILRFLSRSVSLILNAIMMSTMAYTLAKYLLTRDKLISSNPPMHPWATPTILWPTIMLLAMAVVTFIMNAFTLLAYCCGVGAANRMSSVSSWVGYLMLAGQFVAWAVTVGLYRMENGLHSLWGWSCSDESDQIQAQVQSLLNFGSLCTMQQGTWYVSIIEAITYFLTAVTLLLMTMRASNKKKMEKFRESTLSYDAKIDLEATNKS